MSFKIKFINHACFQILRENSSILVDPWFTGKVFNNSWSLLEETAIDDLDLSNLTHIFISHEHPDHLHWPTLKKIKEKCDQNVEVFLCKRRNENVKNNLKKLGFLTKEFEPYQIFKTNKHNFSFCFLKNNHDAAIVFDIEDKIIFNKNDCPFSEDELKYFKSRFFNNRKIDILFNQFSLAGFYGNKEDVTALEKARLMHEKELIITHKILSPEQTVPFASFVRFCRDGNEYLNKYAVSLESVIKSNPELKIFAPSYEQEIPWEYSRQTSIENSKKWTDIFSRESQLDTPPKIPETVLKKSYNEMMQFISHTSIPRPMEDFLVFIEDLEKCCKFSFSSNCFELFDLKNSNSYAGTLKSYDLDGFFKFPWGADTLNITGCFSIENPEVWKKMLLYKDMCYER